MDNNLLGPFTHILKQNKKLKKYIVEIILIIIALTVSIVSLLIYFKGNENQEYVKPIADIKNDKMENLDMYVDIEGSVNKPDMYKVSTGTRLKEIINLAGGLSPDADVGFFHRNFNLSRIITDQEKIYIPSVTDINNNYFTENRQILTQGTTSKSSYINQDSKSENQVRININYATAEELDTLPGIGQVTVQKIINSRPFGALLDLTDKKIINKNVFENIKNLIEI